MKNLTKYVVFSFYLLDLRLTECLGHASASPLAWTGCLVSLGPGTELQKQCLVLSKCSVSIGFDVCLFLFNYFYSG